MPFTDIKDALSKIAVTVVTASLLGTFGVVIKMYHDIEYINRTHVRYEQVIENRGERFSGVDRRLDRLETDVRNILIGNSDLPVANDDGFTREQQTQLNQIMAAIRANEEAVRRQNCLLAGGPTKRPLPPACRGFSQ